MNTKIIFTYIVSSIFSISLFAKDICPANKDVNQVAKQLIEIEMSGIRLLDGAKENCLKQKYRQYKFGYDPDYDKPRNLQYYIATEKDIHISKATLVDKNVNQYEVEYTLNVIDMKGSKKVIKDKIGFYLNSTEKAMKADGCAAVISPPRNLVLLNSCKK